ncbi:MAG: heme lyase CcmF/NrfE family subunit [Rubellimicrobium sp.]|nr:heme lyase CcmF/NrfE family subunit [Rubellimicrobium sp.]
MVAELGHFTLILAALVALVQAVVPMVGAQRNWAGWMALARPAAVLQFLLVGFAFATLVHAFITSDFSLRIVYANSHSAKPFLYKITGVWGNHEGSMMLWVLILSLFGAAVAVSGEALPPRLSARVLSVQAMIGVAFLAFILFTSNPFLRLAEPPLNGRDLNPLLQDPGLAFHPPFLYLGYVGLSVSFSFAIAALIEGRIDAAWARWVRPWALAAWMFLTLGIAMGAWWAYYELGWGGFWFWDPVENASLMPWLIAAALLHSAIVVEKRESLKAWTVLLAILGFAFSLLGTFIVRSGVLTSVHSFASDPSRGVMILAIMGVAVGGALLLFGLRAGAMEARGIFGLVSREGALVLNNILLAVAAFVVFVGTLWPMVAETLIGRVLSVGPPFFNLAFTPFFMLLAIVLPAGAVIAWKRGDAGRAVRAMLPAALLAFAIGALAWAITSDRSALAPVGMALGVWLIAGAAMDLWLKTGRQGLAARLGRLGRLPRSDWGRALGHAGLGVVFVGVAGVLGWQVEDIRTVAPGQSFDLGAYTVTFEGVESTEGTNYLTDMATMTVTRGSRNIAVLHPEKRFYPVAQMPTTEAAIHNGFWADVYLTLGDRQPDGSWAVRSYVKPMALWLWFGALMMAAGGLVSLTDRRLRVAAGAAKRTPAAAVPAQ